MNRALKKDKRRQRTIELIPPEELEKLADVRDIDWVREFERDLQVRQIVAHMDEWTREVWASRQYGYSWREIGAQLGITEQQAKMRFRYAIGKIRQRVIGTSVNGRGQTTEGGGS